MARGKSLADASELEKLEWPYDWPPPWRTNRLLGHDAAEKTLLEAQASGRLHHAWLITGPRGIGKATLAWRFARFLLTGQEGGLFGAPTSLEVAADAPGRNLVDARTHSGLFHLRRSLHPKDNRIRDEIRRINRRPAVETAHEAIEDRSPSPLEAAIGTEALANYERALATLSVEERDGVIARVEFGLGYPEIAAALGKVSPDAARMMVSRALLHLAREMGRA